MRAENSETRLGKVAGERNGESPGRRDHNIAAGLGWFSIGLGLAELLAPRQVACFIGVSSRGRSATVLRLYGLREIAVGVGILSASKSAGWLWGRVAGDALDLASLGFAMLGSGSNRGQLAGVTAAVAGVTALDVYTARQMSQGGRGLSSSGIVRAVASIIVNQAPDQVYAFWRDFKNIARFARHIKYVEIMSDTRSHWTANLPGGHTMQWDAEIIDDQPGVRIAWRTLQGADVPHAGAVSFKAAAGGRGTIITNEFRYRPPGGALMAKVAHLFGSDPTGQISRDLHSFKQVIETGEVMRSDASIHPGMHPAQPPEQRPATSGAGSEAQGFAS